MMEVKESIRHTLHFNLMLPLKDNHHGITYQEHLIYTVEECSIHFFFFVTIVRVKMACYSENTIRAVKP